MASDDEMDSKPEPVVEEPQLEESQVLKEHASDEEEKSAENDTSRDRHESTATKTSVSDSDSITTSDSDGSGRSRSKNKSKKRRNRSSSGSSFDSLSSRSRSRSPKRRRSKEKYGNNKSSSESQIILRVLNLNTRTSLQSLREGFYHEFKSYGKIQSLQVKEVDGGQRIGLVIYYRNSDARRALFEGNNTTMMGTHIQVEIADDVDPEEVQQAGSIIDDQNPRASRTLFIGNLDSETTERDIRRTFKDLGSIIAIEIKNIPTKPPPFAFVQFDSITGVVRAIKKMDGELLGNNRIKCGWGKTMPYEVLWLDGLPEKVAPKDIFKDFSNYGPVKILVDTNRSRALVYFVDDEAVKQVLYDCKMKVLPMMGKKVRMDYASPVLIESFNNQMKRDKVPTEVYRCPKTEIVQAHELRNKQRDEAREAARDERISREDLETAAAIHGQHEQRSREHYDDRRKSRGLLEPPVEAHHQHQPVPIEQHERPAPRHERQPVQRVSREEMMTDMPEPMDEEEQRQALEKRLKQLKKENIKDTSCRV